jgi:hypothetical protein
VPDSVRRAMGGRLRVPWASPARWLSRAPMLQRTAVLQAASGSMASPYSQGLVSGRQSEGCRAWYAHGSR